MHRRLLLASLALPAVAKAQTGLDLFTAGPGSAFLQYGEGLAAALLRAGLMVSVRHSTGSLQNLAAVEDSPGALGTAFLGSVADALAGTPAAGGRRHVALRALLPMYETSFQLVALESAGLREFRQLDGKRVGAGPARGPAETFLLAAAEAAGITVQVVSGDPAAMTEGVLTGQMDALWQGAIVPIPSILAVARRAPAVVFGPGAEVSAQVAQRLPVLAASTVPPGTYPNQPQPIETFAAWNVLVANAALPEETAYRLTQAVLGLTDPTRDIAPMAATTRAANARHNRILPYHPGAARFYREAGVALP